MKKINALIKYEIINLRRGALIWVAAILYAFGIQQAISSMYMWGSSFLSLVGLIKVSWLPLNFIMIPLLLLSMKIGQSDNEIFKTIDISDKERMLSKVLTVSIFNGIILVVNIVLVIVIGVMEKVSIGYFFYETIGYILNSLIFLMMCSSLGLFIGQVVCKKVGEVIGFILTIVSFVILCNFYKTSNLIVPIFDIRTIADSFDVISYDKSYLYHNLLWGIISFILLKITFSYKYKKEENRKAVLQFRTIILIASAACVYLIINIFSIRPSFYDIHSRVDLKGGYSNDRHETFFSKEDCGFYVDKYTMDLSIDNNIKNNCSMELKITKDKVNSIELGLFENLDISKIEVDGEKLNFKRTNNSFIVNLPKEYEKGQSMHMIVNYEGKLNTIWYQGREFFFVRNNAMFLADVFEWYPKLNDSEIKEYDVNIKYSGKNKIYSNLNEENKLSEYKLSGKDKEIFLISGNITERKYKDYLFIGNEEYVNNDKQCDDILNIMTKESSIETKKVILGPFIPGGKKMDETYQKAYLYANE